MVLLFELTAAQTQHTRD